VPHAPLSASSSSVLHRARAGEEEWAAGKDRPDEERAQLEPKQRAEDGDGEEGAGCECGDEADSDSRYSAERCV
jgi:hypothetical protein